MNLSFGSVCSGIEAASVAWHSLGWRAAWLSEIEPFPSAVLRHHYPDVPNLGNMCVLPLSMALGEIDEAPDILVGGTPCQSFSLAGLRSGLLDSRGQLTLKYVELLNEIDTARRRAGTKPCIAVWENVPGVLSSKDNAFGCFLAALSGESEPLPANAKGRWPSAGLVVGPKRTIAWRTLDAQYFGLAQRRKRVFLVASARDDFHPGQVFFESNGLRGHSPPSRSKGEEVAKCITSGTGKRYDPETETILARDGRGSVTMSVDYTNGTLTPKLVGTIEAAQCKVNRGKGVLAFSTRDYGGDASNELSPTLRAGTHKDSHSNGGVMPVIAFNHNAQVDQLPTDARDTSRTDSLTTSQQASVAYMPARTFGADGGIDEHFAERDVSDAIHTSSGSGNKAPKIVSNYAVRRLTPREYERLQGFPDDYTAIPKGEGVAADAPRYKALGNSMAVPCMRWIGERIEKALTASWMDENNWL